MEPHAARMVVDYHELEDKADKLDAFTDTERFSKLNMTDQGLLMTQLGAMSTYLAVLKTRLHREDVQVN